MLSESLSKFYLASYVFAKMHILASRCFCLSLLPNNCLQILFRDLGHWLLNRHSEWVHFEAKFVNGILTTRSVLGGAVKHKTTEGGRKEVPSVRKGVPLAWSLFQFINKQLHKSNEKQVFVLQGSPFLAWNNYVPLKRVFIKISPKK